ncbi:MAG TPA: R3H domain-containing nucleic acid-binding protein [Thermoanaerobaculia bacterium]|nr:R3H domain-containing nucleic acid-binding protein [Thermoanaerobaculia bacterium]
MTQRFEGKSLEDALNSATQALSVERYQLKHHVLLEKRGFLGGMKRIVIEVEIDEQAAPPPVDIYAQQPPVRPAGDRPERGSGGRARPPRGDGRGKSRGGRSGGGRGGDGGRGGRRRGTYESDNTLEPGDFQRFAAIDEDVPPQADESEAAAKVHTWCDRIIALSKLDLVARSEETGDRITVRLYGADGPRLTDRHGELLDAIQVIANKSLVWRSIDKDIELDCQQFKERRVEELGRRARELADIVRRDRQEQLLPAMSPIERRIVHLALQDDEDVATESRGEGFFKRVALMPRASFEPDDSQTSTR